MTRQVCERCLFTPSTCICGAIKRLTNKVSVVILQHPSEEKIAKNTNTDFAMLNSLPLDSTVLLYPNEHATYLDDTNPKPALSNITHLIVIDGTWKKAYKILQLTPLLTKFQTVSFKQLPQSRYAIRKAPRADSLSTLEAVAHSLLLIEQLNPAPLYNLLDELIQKQTQHMPEHVKARYLN